MTTALPHGLSPWNRFGKWLLGMPYPAFATLALLITLAQTGFRYPWQPDADYYMVAQNWPGGSSWDTSIVWVLAPDFLGISNSTIWSFAWTAMMLAGVAVFAWRIRIEIPEGSQRHLFLIFLASGIPVMLTSRIGFYDIPFLSGILLVAILPKYWWTLGVILVAGSNPELGLIAGICGVLVGFGLSDTMIVRRSCMTTAISAVSMSAIFMLQISANGYPEGNRSSLLLTNAATAMTQNLPWLPVLLSTLYLGAWVAVLPLITSPSSLHKKVVLLSGLILVPLTCSLITLDGTRVAVSTAALGFLFALRNWCTKGDTPRFFAKNQLAAQLGAAALAVLVVLPPAISLFVPMPWEGFFPPWESVNVILQNANN